VSHLAAAFENHAVIDAEAWGKNVASENGWTMNLYAVFGANGTVHFTANDHDSGFDLPVHSGAFADYQGIGGKNLASKAAANADSPLKAKLSFEFATVIKNTANFSESRWNCKINTHY
jgi:hypothetical protein